MDARHGDPGIVDVWTGNGETASPALSKGNKVHLPAPLKLPN